MNDRLTRDDLDQTGVQVEALRQDLAGYRIVIERALTRRNRALIAAAAGLVLLLTMQAVGGFLVIRGEEERAERVLQVAQLQACQQVAELRADIVSVLIAAQGDEEVGGPARTARLTDAIEQLRPGPCPDEQPTEEPT